MEIYPEDIPTNYKYHPVYNNDGSKKLMPDNCLPQELANENDIRKVGNPLAVKTWGSTLYVWTFVSVFMCWFVWIYVGYVNWWRNKNVDGVELPETSMVKVGIPVLLSALAIEYILCLILDYESFRWNDLTSSMSNGLVQQLFVMLTKAVGTHFGVTLITAIPYTFIYENYRLACLDGPIGFILMFFARDFCYYWFHRFAHQFAFLWAIHGVHHEPNEFNFSTNLSQGMLQRVASVIFYVPLAFFFPTELYLLIFVPEKLYGAFTHTKLVNKTYTGIERIFVTPSSHRIHHAGRPAKYIDKQYGEMLTIWDRIFGTFVEESEPIVFGHVMPITSWNPFRSQIETWEWLYEKSKQTDSVIKKIKCFIYPPSYNPTGRDYPLLDSHPWNAEKYDETIQSVSMTVYAILHWVAIIVWGIWLLGNYEKVPTGLILLMLAFYNAFSLCSIGMIWDRSSNSKLSETIRLVILPFVMLYFTKLFQSPQRTSLITFFASIFVSAVSLIILFSSQGLVNTGEKRFIKEAGRKFTSLLEEKQKID